MRERAGGRSNFAQEVTIMLARLKLPFLFVTLVAVSTAFVLTRPSASQTRAPQPGTAHPGAVVTGAPVHGPTAFGFLEFDWNGTLPGFSPWHGDATTADLFPHQSNGSE
jgi:hypothetical protein